MASKNSLTCLAIGKIPAGSYFGSKRMMPDEYDNDFKPWYDKQKEITDLSFKQEMTKYCS
jgi:hypothetical protein